MSKARWSDASDGSSFEQAPAGTHIARCYQVIDLGTQHNAMYDNFRRQTFVNFELPNEIRKYRDDNDVEQELPFTIGKFYTASLNEKANLRKDLESWRGRPFTEDELDGFDPENILGVPAMINVSHNKAGKAQITAVIKPPAGTNVPAAVHDPLFFMLDDYSEAMFNKIPGGFQKIIKKSPEWKAINEPPTQGALQPGDEIPGDFVDDELPPMTGAEDDIPF